MHAAPTFPRVEGVTLDGQAVTLPDDFAGDRNLIIVGFGRAQQADVQTWWPVGAYLSTVHPTLAVYRLPVLGRVNAVARLGLEQAMRVMARDRAPAERARAIPLYIDQDEFCRALGLPGPDQVAVVLADREGRVLWRARGPYADQAQAHDLTRALAAH